MDFRDTFGDDTGLPVTAYGIIAAPAGDFNTFVPVIIPEFDPNLQWGPCRWQSRDEISLPAKGDECLVVWDSRREPWIVAWWPF